MGDGSLRNADAGGGYHHEVLLKSTPTNRMK